MICTCCDSVPEVPEPNRKPVPVVSHPLQFGVNTKPTFPSTTFHLLSLLLEQLASVQKSTEKHIFILMPSVQIRATANLFCTAVTRSSFLQSGYNRSLSRYSQRQILASPSLIFKPVITQNRFTIFTRTMASSAAAKRLEGKTVLITGASSGIGRSTALEFARTNPNGNLRLIVTARRTESLEELAAEIHKETNNGVKVLPVKLDVSKADEIRGFVNSLPEEWRDIHVLVNNAGLVKGVAKAPEIDEEDMNVVFTTNVTGLINMTQAILPIFQKRPNGGQGDIINIGSIAGREPYPGGGIYCASKAAVRSFTDSLRKELIATRIRVIEIDPGQVETEFSVVRFYGDKAKADAVYAGCDPLTPEDIAEVIVFAATRRENVVVAESLLYPNHQASALIMHRRPT
ncbi:hypothetical protein J3F84DRAFT_387708 [Trichoderma pleuroticola]